MKLNLPGPKAVRPIVLIVSLFFAGSLSAQSIKLNSPADSLTAGEVFNYSIILQLDQEYKKIIFPDTTSFPPDIELIGKQQFKISNFTDSLSYKLQFFAVEDIVIPPLPIQLISETDTSVVFTEEVPLYFKTIIEGNKEEAETKPLKPVFDFPRALWPWILAAIFLAGFLVWWFFFRKKPEPEQAKPVVKVKEFHNPLKELERTLEAIKEESKVAETKNFKLFYSKISDSIRTYYEDLYHIPALESTSRELLRYLDAYGVDHEMIDATRKVLNRADMVKFAKFTPTLDDAWKTYAHAVDFKDRARQVDSSRISRLKREYEQQFITDQEETKAGGQ